jgi:peptidoglycan/LPS O-acetylase OafA/YrhL
MEHRIRILDGWRGLAVLSVLFGHFFGVPGLNLGIIGVELFFVLSGRLMAEILFVEGVALDRFFPRRFSRVYPALFMFACVAMVASKFMPGAHMGLGHFLTVITFTYNYYSLAVPHAGVIDHIWSLCIEEHLYFVLGAIAFVHRRRPLPVPAVLAALAALCAFDGLISTLLGYDYYHVYWRSDVRGASILIGAAAFLWLRHRSAPGWLAPALALLGVALNSDALPDPLKYTAGTACLASAVALLPSAVQSVRDGLQSRALLWFGLVSYSIYLWQQPFYTLSHKVGFAGILAPVAIVVGFGSFTLVEQPARRWLNRFFDRLRDRAHIASGFESAPTGLP